MKEIQENKYACVTFGEVNNEVTTTQGVLVNRETGKEIPADEPVFVLRAQDELAVAALRFYMGMCESKGHKNNVMMRIRQFEHFREKNPERMKKPD